MNWDLIRQAYEAMGVPMDVPMHTPTVTGKLYLRYMGKDSESDRDLYMVLGLIAVPEDVIVGDGSGVMGDGQDSLDKDRMTVAVGHVHRDGSTIMMELYQNDAVAWRGVHPEARKLGGDGPAEILTSPIWQV